MFEKRRIGHADARIKTVRRVDDRPLYDKWTGLAEVDGEEVRFTTNCQEFIPGERYHIVYERTEFPLNGPGIKIHEIIQ